MSLRWTPRDAYQQVATTGPGGTGYVVQYNADGSWRNWCARYVDEGRVTWRACGSSPEEAVGLCEEHHMKRGLGYSFEVHRGAERHAAKVLAKALRFAKVDAKLGRCERALEGYGEVENLLGTFTVHAATKHGPEPKAPLPNKLAKQVWRIERQIEKLRVTIQAKCFCKR